MFCVETVKQPVKTTNKLHCDTHYFLSHSTQTVEVKRLIYTLGLCNNILDPSGHKNKSAALMLATQKDTFLDPLGKWVWHIVNGVGKVAKKHYHSCQTDPQRNNAYPEPTVWNHTAITGSCDFCWKELVGQLLTLTNLRSSHLAEPFYSPTSAIDFPIKF